MGLLAATPVRIVFALFLSRPHGNDCVFVGVSPGVLQPILLRERLGLFTLGGFKLETYQRNNEHTVVEAHSCLSHKKLYSQYL